MKTETFQEKVKEAGSIENYWTNLISDKLVGKTITKVQYISKEETENMMWYKSPIAIQLNNRDWIYPMSDDEANDGGSMGTSIKGLGTIPTL
jgi:hypothetical protein